MTRLLFGVESEYAIGGVDGNEPISRDSLVNRYVCAAHRRLRHLQDMATPQGMFLENGARFYIDCGQHPEMATPECTTPWELARYIKAGERILEELTEEVQASAGPTAEVMCFRCNVDYSASAATWGCHESYLHRADPLSLPEQLIPHLVTRVVYAGAGGFNPLVNHLEFCVAPRLMHIEHAISGDSTGSRGIFHTRNEPLAGDGYKRLHILCGESLCSETAIVLKSGATALVTALAEQGLTPGAGLRLASPLEALHIVACDVTCKRKLRLAGGGETTAVEIQRRFLDMAERHLGVLPPWAGAVCSLWRLTLDRLAGAPDSVATVLDWAMKHRLFHGRAERRGISGNRFGLLNSLVQRLNVSPGGDGNGKDIPLSVLLGPESPVPLLVERLGKELKAEKLTWDDVERFVSLRNEFCQIDTRFGQIGPRGIFTELDRRGVLDHKVSAIDGVDAAVREPPAASRAKVRGEAVRRLSGQARVRCTWQAIATPDGRTLDLNDPFATAEVWVDPPAQPQDSKDLPQDIPQNELSSEPGHLHWVVQAMRRRRGGSRTRAERPPDTTAGPHQ